MSSVRSSRSRIQTIPFGRIPVIAIVFAAVLVCGGFSAKAAVSIVTYGSSTASGAGYNLTVPAGQTADCVVVIVHTCDLDLTNEAASVTVGGTAATAITGGLIWHNGVSGADDVKLEYSSEPRTKSLAGGVFTRELELPRTTTRLATEQGDALVALGYHAQVIPHQDNVALFKLDGIRQTVHFRDGAFVVGETRVPERDLVEQSRRCPECFSPNVLLRPIVQDTLFPTVCYIAGPNELAYLAQLRPIYAHFGVPEPLMLQRATATLLDSAGARFLDKYHLAFEALQPDNEATLNHLLEHELPRSVEEAFEEVSRSVETGMARLVEAVPAIDPTLGGAAKSSLGRMQHDLHVLHEKIIHAAKRRDDTLRRQFARTRALAFPDGHPQERALGFVYFLNRYGPALIDRLHDDLPLDMRTHAVLAL